MDSITFRPATDDEYPAFAKAFVEGFSDDLPDDDFGDLFKKVLPPERTLVAFDGEEIVGTFAGYDLELAVPGGRLKMEGTTAVTVAPTHRRMGLMNEMMQRHLDRAASNGFAIAGLWASETNLYGRYGYGIATYADTITMTASEIVFRDDVPVDRVRRVSTSDAHDVLPAVFDRAMSQQVGVMARSADWWLVHVLDDAEWMRRGKTRIRIVVHDGPDGPDGYAIYRQKSDESDDGHASGTVHVTEVIATTDAAHASLWSYLTRIDGCPNVRAWNIPIDDPLSHKLLEPRRVRRQAYFDALWIRILDIPAALQGRRYEEDGTIGFTVLDPYRAETAGSFELTVEDGIGVCMSIDDEAALEIDVDVLGALFLGGGDAHAYAAANRVRGDSGTVDRMHSLFRTGKAPWCNQVF